MFTCKYLQIFGRKNLWAVLKGRVFQVKSPHRVTKVVVINRPLDSKASLAPTDFLMSAAHPSPSKLAGLLAPLIPQFCWPLTVEILKNCKTPRRGKTNKIITHLIKLIHHFCCQIHVDLFVLIGVFNMIKRPFVDYISVSYLPLSCRPAQQWGTCLGYWHDTLRTLWVARRRRSRR